MDHEDFKRHLYKQHNIHVINEESLLNDSIINSTLLSVTFNSAIDEKSTCILECSCQK